MRGAKEVSFSAGGKNLLAFQKGILTYDQIENLEFLKTYSQIGASVCLSDTAAEK